jgi:hypothetical protein
MSSIKMFVSYSHEDSETADFVQSECARLQLDAFLDRKNIDWGESVSDSVGRGLGDCTHLLLILSPGSLKSNWVFYEVGRGTERSMPILVFLVHRSVEPPGFLKDRKHVVGLEQLRAELQDLASKAQDKAEAIREQLLHITRIIDKLPTQPRARLAMKYSVNAILAEHHKSLSDLERGEIIAPPGATNRVYGHFIDASDGFKAVSADDLDYWVTNESRDYLDQNERLIERNGSVERIFLLNYTAASVSKNLDKLKKAVVPQIKMGIRVSIAFYANCNDLGDRKNIGDLDFGLFDDFAVSFFRLEDGRSYNISIRPDACEFRKNLYAKVMKRCEEVPGKAGPNRRVFETEAEFIQWTEGIDPG